VVPGQTDNVTVFSLPSGAHQTQIVARYVTQVLVGVSVPLTLVLV
jgi:hypothetical protein